MIRGLSVSALSALGLAAAAACLSPDLVAGPRGEPLIVSEFSEASLQPAGLDLDGGGCPVALPFAEAEAAGLHIVAYAFRPDSEDVAVALEDYSDASRKPAETVILVFDKSGRLIATGDPEALGVGDAGCLPPRPAAGAPA